MGVVGTFLLGLGICFLVPVVFALIHGEVMACVVCSVLMIFMISVGVVLIRKAEDKATRRSQEPERSPVSKGPANPFRGTMAKVYSFDLNRFNWIGWILLVTTFGFAGAMGWISTLLLADDATREQAGRLIGSVILFSAIAFFAGLRWLLRVVGVTIYRW